MYSEIVLCLAYTSKTCDFGVLIILRGTPIVVLLNFVKFYLFFIFTYLKNFMYLVQKVKSLNFGGSVWEGKPPIVTSPIFVWFSLFLISTNFENLIHLAPTA